MLLYKSHSIIPVDLGWIIKPQKLLLFVQELHLEISFLPFWHIFLKFLKQNKLYSESVFFGTLSLTDKPDGNFYTYMGYVLICLSQKEPVDIWKGEGP